MRFATSSNQFRLPLAILLLAALAVTHNSYALGLDLMSGRLANFSREMTIRDAALLACREHGDETCRLEGIQARPASFLVLDVSADPHDFVNESYARYFDSAGSASRERRRQVGLASTCAALTARWLSRTARFA